MEEKQAIVLGRGQGIWNFAHIADVAAFYTLLPRKILEEETFDSGKNGYYFIEAGETSWLNISQRIANAAFSQHLLLSPDLKSITPEQMCQALSHPFLTSSMVEVIWASKYVVIPGSKIIPYSLCQFSGRGP